MIDSALSNLIVRDQYGFIRREPYTIQYQRKLEDLVGANVAGSVWVDDVFSTNQEDCNLLLAPRHDLDVKYLLRCEVDQVETLISGSRSEYPVVFRINSVNPRISVRMTYDLDIPDEYVEPELETFLTEDVDILVTGELVDIGEPLRTLHDELLEEAEK